ncbi:MAG: dienelactone hydrolase family protein [Cyanobium sp.]
MGAATEFSGFRAERLPEQPDPNRNGGGDDGKTDRERRLYYVKGEGAPLILLHELPGLSRQTFALGDYFVQRGFRVSLPLLFGRAGDCSLLAGTASICLRQELRQLWLGTDTTITAWVRQLAAEELKRYQQLHPEACRVGVIGMCYSGSMVLALMLKDDAAASPLVTPVLAQPSARYPRHALEQIRQQGARGPALALRFEKDWICRDSQLTSLEQAFAACAARDPSQALSVVEFEGKQHSTLVYDYDQTNPFRRDIRSGQWLDARDLVCQFLRHQMGVS